MIRQIEVDRIINRLNTVPAITGVFPWWIFFGKPWIPPNQNYCNIRVVSDNSKFINKIARLEFRVIGGSKDTPPAELFDAVHILAEEIAIESCNKIFNFDWFTVWKVNEDSVFWPDYDANERPVILKDYLFTYIAR